MDVKKKLLLGLLAVVIAVLFVYFALPDKGMTTYLIEAKYDDGSKTVEAVQTVRYVNTTGASLKEICFHLYPNAFKSEENLPFTKEELPFVYPEGFAPGFIEIEKVTINGLPAVYTLEEPNDEILRLTLPREIKKGESVNIKMQYKVKLPPARSRFGYGKNTVQLGNWYPILSVYDKNGWNNDPYYIFGDPFYSDIADYKVELTVPEKFVVACTGEEKEQKVEKGSKKLVIEAHKVRDFAIVMSDKFKVIEQVVDGIKVKSYYFTEGYGDKVLKFASDAIKFYNDYIGKYPYKEYSVVETDFYMGGMEYPQLVMISKDLYNKANLFNLEYVIAHETAHQWWYALVGNNQIRESWLDEGLTEYTTLLYIERYYGKATAEEIYRLVIEGGFNKFVNNSADTSFAKTLADFKEWKEYTNIAYNKGAMVFYNLRKLIGDEDFKKVLQTYYEKYKYKIATTQDLIDVVDSVTGKDTGGFFQSWFY
ncbi:aminopeptidase N [Caldanaerobacter subterraneus subsp. tengcongensis MB4]|uniref:Aminopeptidase N n=1 Tax=Caldanaerobacter subterraneus subsp. tengcongensis (strain DSM 15242 / JCM 11007 / NBRC 100824 / MB4) TaxID=273068 RepID=Q8R6U0_CALS4|nr:M1 family metallopeptidase [Caldanaerobacter subterraneus]AAM25813.1 Aminopeptidase N [Caldanaerobacter subterraneus subsp. tengcongensis MB4]MCS3917316.1 aminopeptidase N [Caldanaerobacter subterraneus subsp. tengcongensis MB4]